MTERRLREIKDELLDQLDELDDMIQMEDNEYLKGYYKGCFDTTIAIIKTINRELKIMNIGNIY
jgi:hypothetical protein